ncbi:MAG TPA: thioredoxin domain-containing protein [Streptosporangiaceae bacterium]|jgi:protein-disulfide isomerase
MSTARPWNRPRVLIGGAAVAVVVVVLVAVAVWRGRAPDTQAAAHVRATPSSAGTIAGPKAPVVPPAMMQGSAKAPVLIEEFADYQCAACGAFGRTTEPVLVKKYVDTGAVRILWRDMPDNGKASEAAAIAGRAAARQNKFWPFNRAVFALKPTERNGKLTASALRGAAKQAGLDLGKYDADIKDPALRNAVEQDQAFGEAIGAPGSPAFLINGEAFFGNQSLAKFEKAIDKARKG